MATPPIVSNPRENDIFICYASDDIAVVQRLDAAIRSLKRDPWIDWEDLPPGIDPNIWWKYIEAGILNADVFVFVISPSAITSEQTRKQLQLAIELRKRLIPFLGQAVPDSDIPETLRDKTAWVSVDSDNLTGSLEKSAKAIVHILIYERLRAQSKRWESSGRAPDLLLQGTDLESLKRWVIENQELEPRLTPLQQEYLGLSAEAESAGVKVKQPDVFISYSRRDKFFVEKLVERLKQRQFNVWIDWENIPVASDWSQEIRDGITAAHTFLFIISPDSVASRYCLEELNLANEHGKRLIGILWRSGYQAVSMYASEGFEALSNTHWLDFSEIELLDVTFPKLVQAIDTDYEYVKFQTTLEFYALDWLNNGRSDDWLLRGAALKRAERWLNQSQSQSVLRPTEFQQLYIQTSINKANLFYWITRSLNRLNSQPQTDTDRQFQQLITVPIEPPAAPKITIPLRGVGGLRGAGNDSVKNQEDQLNFQHYVKVFADLIDSPYTKPPLTIGIFGSWGMGKSFLLENIVKELARRYESQKPTQTNLVFKLRNRQQQSDPDRNRGTSTGQPTQRRVYVVEFNAWEYNSAEVIWPGLVRKIMNEIERQVVWKFPGQFWTKFGRNVQRQFSQSRNQLIMIVMIAVGLIAYWFWKNKFDLKLFWTAIVTLGVGGVLKAFSDTSKPLSQWITTLFQERNYGKQIGYMEEIRDDMKLLANMLKDNERILIIIDDLDRCEPRKAVEVLQAVKLLLDFDNFIVCLGIDARIITCAIEEYYKNLLGQAGASGYEYLDKIVQIPFRIPEPSPTEIRDFIAKQLLVGSELDPQLLQNDENWNDLIQEKSIDTALLNPQPIADIPQSIAPVSENLTRESGLDRSTTNPSSTKAPTATSMPVSLLTSDSAEPALSSTLLTDSLESASELPDSSTEETHSLIAFTVEEVQAFQRLARFLRPNPRHLKRIINVYRLVRTLAVYQDQRVILDDPLGTAYWLVICGQWPYTANAMMCYFDEMLEWVYKEKLEGKSYWFPTDDPLLYLYKNVKGQLVPERRDKFDHDPDWLEQILTSQQGKFTWETLRIMRQYTVNFNPAIEAELRSEAAIKIL